MSRNSTIAASVLGLALSALPAIAGDGWRGPVVVRDLPPWYHQEPWVGTGPEAYFSRHPDHIPAYPKPLTGHAVPIFDTSRPVVHARPVRAADAHGAWCAARYRSYDWHSDTWQPHHGARRVCWSPYR